MRSTFGSPDIVAVEEIEKPAVGDDDVLVRVRAASVNRADWYALTGTPYAGRVQMGLRKPRQRQLGVDFAGTVEEVGASVADFAPGDDVFGAKSGAFAEYVAVGHEGAVAGKPPRLTFEEAAAAPVAALTALQALRDRARLQPAQRLIINGASGGVGTFAVQIGKALGAEVTAVCSTRNVELVRSLGADEVIDYTREDFTRSEARYDALLDVAGSRSWSECRRVLARDATVVVVGGPKTNRLVGPLGHVARMRAAGWRSSQNVVFFIARLNKQDLAAVAELLEAGHVRPVVERRYRLDQVADALRYMGEGHAQGKVVVTA